MGKILIHEDSKLESYFNKYCATFSKDTNYRNYINSFLKIINKPFWDHTNADVQKYFSHCLARMANGKMTGATALSHFKGLSSFTDSIPEIKHNYFREYTKQLKRYESYKVSADKVISTTDIDIFLDAAKDDLYVYTLISLAYNHGLRTDELINLSIDSFEEYDNKTYCYLKDRVIALSEETSDTLKKYRETYNPKSNLFTTPKGEPIYTKYIQRILDPIRKKTGIQNMTLQRIRNSSAAAGISCGIPLEVLGQKYGIKNLKNMRRYDIYSGNLADQVDKRGLKNIVVKDIES